MSESHSAGSGPSSTFDLVKTLELPDYHGTGLLYRHRATGMEVFHVKNDDSERFCCFIFRTLASSGNGASHILEHTVLSGSKKFPVKDPFMAVSCGSVNTFMNAMTSPGCTLYPFASVLEKDFRNIFEVYADAVFDPLLRRESFMLEGIRRTPEGFDGVVFNEMKGNCSDQESLVGFYSSAGLFPGTPYGYDCGGNILEIPDLTYEKYLELYRFWYHPSNCRLFMYGDLDIPPYLQDLKENYLAGRSAAPTQGPWTALTKDTPFRLDVPGPASDSSSVLVCWATCPEDSRLDAGTLSFLVEVLLGDPGNPLYRAITESGLGQDLSDSSGMGVGFFRIPFAVGFSGARREDAEKIETFIMDTLRKICEEGIDPDLIRATLKAEAFSLREVQRKYMPIGYSACSRALRGWLGESGDPFISIGTTAGFRDLEKAIAADPRYLEKWIERNLLNNPRRMLLTVYPDENYEKNIAEKLKAKFGPADEAELEKQEQHLKAFRDEPDSPQALASVGHLKLEDLGDAFRYFPYDRSVVAGRTLYTQTMFTNGICYFNMSFDTRDLSEEEHLLLPLLTRLMWMTGVGELDYSAVAVRLKELTGGSLLAPACAMTVDGRPVSMVILSAKATREDTPAALAFLARMLRDTDVSDTGRIKAAVTDLLTDFKANFIELANVFSLRRVTAPLNPSSNEQEVLTGIRQWQFLCEIDKAPVGETAAKLEALRSRVFCRLRLEGQTGSDPDDLGMCVSAFEAFALALDPGPDTPVVPDPDFYRTAPYSEKESFIIPGQVAYNGVAVPLGPQTDKQRMAKIVLGAMISDNALWEGVRGGGAYMAYARMAAYNDCFCFSSYRDPRIGGTLKDFRSAVAAVAAGAADPGVVLSEIISLIGRELRPRSPADICGEARKSFVLGMSEERLRSRLRAVLALKAEDIVRQAQELLKAMDGPGARTLVFASEERLRPEGFLLPGTITLNV